MKTISLGTAVVMLLMARSALAADLPVDVAIAPVPAMERVPNWTGLYVGANLGYARNRGGADIVDLSSGTSVLGLSENMSGPIGGGQIGVNWQTGNAVLGVEADVAGSAQSASSSASFAGLTATNTDKITGFGSLRGRIGFSAHRFLFYATAGWMYGTWRSNVAISGIGTTEVSRSQGGSAIGAGIEAAITDNWIVRGEYLYLQSTTLSTNPFPAAPTLSVNARIQDSVFRIGVNYLFATGSVGCLPHMC
jgi:outer membrane immunogenic protein